MPELDSPTEVIPRPAPVDAPPAYDDEARLAGIPRSQLKIGGAMIAVFAVVGTVGSLAGIPGLSTPPPAPAAKPSAYQQGYAYGQRLDNQGYGDQEAYEACRGRISQTQDDIGTFQFACDVGYAQ